MRIGVLMSRVRVEEKLLMEAFAARDVQVDTIDDREVVFDMHDPQAMRQYDVVLERCINHSRALYALEMLNAWGVPTVNTAAVANVCGNKFSTSRALIEHSVPTPRTLIAFTQESALAAIEMLGYPVVLKPAVGSWGRLISKINDREAAEAVLEHKAVLGSYHHSIFTFKSTSPSRCAISAPLWWATRPSAPSIVTRRTGSPTPHAAARPATAP